MTQAQNREKLNVNIPLIRDAFKQFYLSELLELLQIDEPRRFRDTRQGFFNCQTEQSLSEEPPRLAAQTASKQLDREAITRLSLKLAESKKLSNKPPCQYYYKRWIWIQFPWACMSTMCNYSLHLKNCFNENEQ